MSAAVAASTQGTSQGQVGTPGLLSGVRPDEIVDDPYAHFVRSNILPADIYAALEADFPSLEMILNGRAAGSNQAVRMTVKQVLNDRRISALWREFFEYHTSGDYWRDVVRLFGNRFRSAF